MSTLVVVLIYLLFPYFIHLNFVFDCMLSILMSCDCTYLLIRLLNASIDSFLLSVGCTFSDIFLSQDAKRIASVRFSFKFFKLVNLDMTKLDCSISTPVLR